MIKRWPLGLLLAFVILGFLTGIVPTVLLAMEGPAGAAPDPLLGESLLFSLWVAGLSSLVACLLGTLLALAVWRLRAPWQGFSQIYRLPLVLPHLAAALIVLLFWGPGSWMETVFRILGLEGAADLLQSFFYGSWGISLVLAYLFKEIPFVMLWVLAALGTIPPGQWEMARHLGAGRLRVLALVIWPWIRPSVLASGILLFLYTFGAFEIPYVLGISRPSMVAVRIHADLYQRSWEYQQQAFGSLAWLGLASFILLWAYTHLTQGRQYHGRKL